ncbi:MAG: TVP38/TMEM64 family protein [Clostridia bacterium]|nr:TVP38/TMEM64 family protein [Clostridia bacterium]
MKANKTKNIINYCGITLIILAIVLFLMTQTIDFDAIKAPSIISKDTDFKLELDELTKIQEGYIVFKGRMIELEESIARFGNVGYMIFIILLLFSLKSVVALVPISATCLLSGVLFPFHLALIVNFVGISILMSIKYLWGKKLGGGNISKIVKRYPTILEIFEHNGSGNPWVLFVFRLVPSFPVNSISQLYGSMNFNFRNYLLISIAGFSLKLISFTIIGSNVYDPLSSAFIVPIIIILFVSGTSMLLVNGIISITTKSTSNKYKKAKK